MEPSMSPEIIRELFLIAIKKVVNDIGQGLLDLQYINIGENSSIIITKANHVYYPHDFVSEFEETNQGLTNTKEFCELNVIYKPIRVVISFKTFRASLQIHRRQINQISKAFWFNESDNLWHLSNNLLDILQIIKEVDDGTYQICCGFTKEEVESEEPNKFLLRLKIPYTMYISAKCRGVLHRCIPPVTEEVPLPRCQSCKNYLNRSKRKKERIEQKRNNKMPCGNLFLNARSSKMVKKLTKLTLTLNKYQSNELKEIVSTISSELLDKLNEVINAEPDYPTRQTFIRVWKKDCETRRQVDLKTGCKDDKWSIITFRLALAVYVRCPAGFNALKHFSLLNLPSESSLLDFQGNVHPLDEAEVIGNVLWNSSNNKLVGLAMTMKEMCVLRDVYFILNNDKPEKIPYYEFRNQKMRGAARALKFKKGSIDPEYVIKKEFVENIDQEHDELHQIPRYSKSTEVLQEIAASSPINAEEPYCNVERSIPLEIRGNDSKEYYVDSNQKTLPIRKKAMIHKDATASNPSINGENYTDEPYLNNESSIPLAINVIKNLDSKQDLQQTEKAALIDGIASNPINVKNSSEGLYFVPYLNNASSIPLFIAKNIDSQQNEKAALIEKDGIASNPINVKNYSEEPYLNNESSIPLAINVKDLYSKQDIQQTEKAALIEKNGIASNQINERNFSNELNLNNESSISLVCIVKNIDSQQNIQQTEKEALIDQSGTALNPINVKNYSEERYLNNESSIPLVINFKNDLESKQDIQPTEKAALIDEDGITSNPINEKNYSEEPYLNNSSPLVFIVKNIDSTQDIQPTEKEPLIDQSGTASNPINMKNYSKEPYLNNESSISLAISVEDLDSKPDIQPTEKAALIDQSGTASNPINVKNYSEESYLNNQSSIPLSISVEDLDSKPDIQLTEKEALIDQSGTASNPINVKNYSEESYLNNQSSIPLSISVEDLDSKPDIQLTEKEALIDQSGTASNPIIVKNYSEEPYLNNQSSISLAISVEDLDSKPDIQQTEKEPLFDQRGTASNPINVKNYSEESYLNNQSSIPLSISVEDLDSKPDIQPTEKAVPIDQNGTASNPINVKNELYLNNESPIPLERLPIKKEPPTTELRVIITRCDEISNITNLPRITENLFKCDPCNYATPFEECLNQHKKCHLKCGNCSFTSLNITRLQKHELIHLPKPYKCDQCSFATRVMDYLNHHRKAKFKCENCSFTSCSKGVLKRHESIHIPNSFKCDNCSFSSRSKGVLKIHESIHLPKPLKCDDSSFSLRSKRGLKQHESIRFPNSFKCDDSSFSFRSKRGLKQHESIRLHKAFKCEHCSFSCDSNEGLKQHESIHLHNAFKCDDCSFSSRSKGGLIKHESIHLHNSYKCEHCSFSSRSKIGLKQHKSIHLQKTFKCEHCSFSCDSNEGLKQHESIHLHKPFKCDDCSFSSRSKGGLIKHESIHLHNSYKCEHCSFSCDSKIGLKQHKRIHIPKPFKCVDCSFSSHSKFGLKQHKRIHIPKAFKCDKCSFSSPSKVDLKQHESIHILKLFNCDNCLFSSRSKFGLKQHKCIHIPKPFKCDKCSFLSSSEVDLKLHELIHFPKFKCNNCSFSSHSKVGLKQHKCIHIPKPFKCDKCSFATRFKMHLYQHKQKHLPVKPFECDKCSFASLFKGHLYQHKKAHLVKCDECSFSSHAKASLAKHKLTHLSEKQKNVRTNVIRKGN